MATMSPVNLFTMMEEIPSMEQEEHRDVLCNLFPPAEVQDFCLSPSPAATHNATSFLPFKTKTRRKTLRMAGAATAAAAIDDDDDDDTPYLWSPSSSKNDDDLQHMVSAITLKQEDCYDVQQINDDDDEELFLLMAPSTKEKAKFRPPPMRRMLRPRPLRMRLQKNQAQEEEDASVGLCARAVYLGACSAAPPLIDLPESEREEIAATRVRIRLGLKRVHAKTDILEHETTASTIKRQNNVMYNFDDLCNSNKRQMTSSSHMSMVSTPQERAPSKRYWLPSPPSPPPFRDFLAPRTPHSGLILNF